MTVSLNLNIHNKKIIILKSSHENTPHCVCWDVLIEKYKLKIVFINPFIPKPDFLDTCNFTTLIRNRLANRYKDQLEFLIHKSHALRDYGAGQI